MILMKSHKSKIDCSIIELIALSLEAIHISSQEASINMQQSEIELMSVIGKEVRRFGLDFFLMNILTSKF